MRLPSIRLPKPSRGVSLLLGFVIAALIIPGVAVATTNLVTIANSNQSRTAQVTASNQLQVAPASAAETVETLVRPTCDAGGAYTVPAGKALIITSVTFYNLAEAARLNELDLMGGPLSSPCSSFLAAGIANGETVSSWQGYNPGIPVPAGDSLGMLDTNDSGSAHVLGYLVPAAAVPANALANLPRAPRNGGSASESRAR
jgi:hypothetical protein